MINQAFATRGRLLDACISSNEPVFCQNDSETSEDCPSHVDPESENNGYEQGDQSTENNETTNSYSTVIKLITGSLVGDVHFDDVYKEADCRCESNDEQTNNENLQEHNKSSKTENGPTLHGIAQRVAREEKPFLDKKQYMMYEILCCTFLLSLVRDGGSLTGSSPLKIYVSGSLDDQCKKDMTNLIKELKRRGGRKQLIMFATGLAGAGKSTGIKVAKRFCYEFCKAAYIMWNDNTFISKHTQGQQRLHLEALLRAKRCFSTSTT